MVVGVTKSLSQVQPAMSRGRRKSTSTPRSAPVVSVSVASTLIAEPTLVYLATKLRPLVLAVWVKTPPGLVTVPPKAAGWSPPNTSFTRMSSSHTVP